MIYTDLEEGAQVKLRFGNEKGEVASRQKCSADDVIPSASVLESDAFALVNDLVDVPLRSPYAFIRFNSDVVVLDSIHVASTGSESLCHGSDHIALIPDGTAPKTLWAVA